ncbi:ABC transporter permease [Oscillospiraceae bacterium MB08-C2-2]|nr:ABC transporter permease [Oscillospiraceae bacterium MB08-C2-2]
MSAENNRSGAKRSLGDIAFWLFEKAGQPVVALIIAFFVGGLAILASGENPLKVYSIMFEKTLFHLPGIMNTLARSTPIIICAMGLAIAWRANYETIGSEGQMILGGISAAITALYLPAPGIVRTLVAIVVAIIVAGVYSMAAGFLDTQFRVPLVICSLLLNSIAALFGSYLVGFPFKDLSSGGIAIQTPQVEEAARIPKMVTRYAPHWGLLVAILLVAATWFFMNRTVFGYESKMVGLNSNFARYGGVRRTRVMYVTLFIAGACAGLAGAFEVLGMQYRFVDQAVQQTNYPWTGLMAVLIGGYRPIATALISLALAAIQYAGTVVARETNVTQDIAKIIQATLTLLVAARLLARYIATKKSQRTLRRREQEQDGLAAVTEGGDDHE